jgi:hypothetical protein
LIKIVQGFVQVSLHTSRRFISNLNTCFQNTLQENVL